MKYSFLLLYSICLAACQPAERSAVTIDRTSIEYMQEPSGLDVKTPRFSWTLDSKVRGAEQTAYQIVVSENSSEITNERGEIWDSGKTESNQTLNIVYQGEPLMSGKRYYWSVRMWDEDGEASRWSSPQSFRMGVLDESEWQAQWISHPDTTLSAPMLRKEFSISQEIKEAWAYVTGVGYFELYLNGEKVGDHVLDPGVTDHRVRVLYETFDLTKQLQQGDHAVGFVLGDGPFRVVDNDDRYAWSFHSLGAPRGFLQLHITYTDGSEDVIISDESWKASSGPITYVSLFGGEDYDARLEQPGWNRVEFDDSEWQPVEVIDDYDVILTPQLMEPIRVTHSFVPQTEVQVSDSVTLYDLEQNIAGWWRIEVEGAEGTEIRVRAAETLNDNPYPEPLKEGDRLSTDRNYQESVWTTYTLKGEGKETYEPRFFYNGFRFLEVRVSAPDQIEQLKIEGQMAYSDLGRNGHFESSSSLFNQIYHAAIWSQKGNLHSVPTDCPQREKGAYNGDGQIVAETSIHDFHMQPFYRKWLNDMRDAQEENGRIPNTSPTVIGGMGGGIAWGSAYILIPSWMYQYYGDVGILKDHYSTMQFYLEFLADLAQNDSEPEKIHMIGEFGSHWSSLGEWCAPGESDGPNRPVTSTYYWYLNNLTMAEVAKALGKDEDHAMYLATADSIKETFNEQFFDPETNLYGADQTNQTFQLYALSGNLVPEGHEEGVMETLIHDIMVTKEGHLNTGILGTKHLFHVLAHAEREDVLHTMVSKTTYPSWGHWVTNHMTTLGERWEWRSSLNHQMFGTVNEYYYKYLGGIQAPTDPGTSIGYETIHIKPYVPDDLTYAEASVETVRGLVESRWEKKEGKLLLNATLPVGSKGKISVPINGWDASQVVIRENGTKIWDMGSYVRGTEGVSGASEDARSVSFEVTSGRYEFEVETSN